MLARGHGGPVDFGECLREIAQAVGQRMALHHFAAHAEHDSLNPGLFGLFGDGLQRFLERQSGAQKGGKLAGQEREIERREAAAHERSPLALILLLALRGFLDLHGQELLFAQQLPHVLRGVAFDQPLAFPSLGVEGDIFERAHPSPRG